MNNRTLIESLQDHIKAFKYAQDNHRKRVLSHPLSTAFPAPGTSLKRTDKWLSDYAKSLKNSNKKK